MDQQQPRRKARAIAISAAKTREAQRASSAMGAFGMVLGALAFWMVQHLLMVH